ncbi:MAG: metal dependent phosphohydrolase [Deltaproteobacteria bacterium]|nr:metal dependent phosphohydrolase [Deltaproteobacteria bacterium]
MLRTGISFIFFQREMAPLQNIIVEKVLRQIEHLPTLPQVVMKILAMTDSEKINALDLSKELDQSLSAKVLKVANSAYYGGRAARTVTSLHHAIMIIGFDMVKEIVLTASFFHTFKDSEEVEELKPLWTHSLGCALVAKRLAWVYRYETLDEAYLVGLIHDIGKLVIKQYFPDQYRLIQSRSNWGPESLKVEKEVLGMTHAQIAGRMAEQWNFHESLAEAIAHHHDEKWELNPKLGRILFYANRFVSGRVDFNRMLELFTQAGMHFPLNWHLNELKRVEEIFHEEMNKASSLMNPPAAEEPPSGAV